ncbi:HAD family hydrolase [Staphylococcus massiliensis]|uniref:Phosphatase phosphohexomutase n=1 Tax=Staphylococcus massiliensis S46 TaxID=1229783 RepID=K9ASG7_9STAP|nr:HAD-IA family hydrolase [Staphylococcus massiliensis]EKU48996.1 phosphatase phosphohexomutase [Staphylococcus massiliensis S46]
MYKAVVFDFDGTIIDTETYIFETINKYLKIAGETPLTKEGYRQSIGGSGDDVYSRLRFMLGTNMTKLLFQEQLGTSHQLPVREAVEGFIDYLQKRNVPMAIATSSYRSDITPILERLEIKDLFNVIIGLEDVEAVKPEPDLYLKAVQALNYSPSHCLAIEDSLNGAKAATMAGLDCIVNTNEMSQQDDFSSVALVGKEVSTEEMIQIFEK